MTLVHHPLPWRSEHSESGSSVVASNGDVVAHVFGGSGVGFGGSTEELTHQYELNRRATAKFIAATGNTHEHLLSLVMQCFEFLDVMAPEILGRGPELQQAKGLIEESRRELAAIQRVMAVQE